MRAIVLEIKGAFDEDASFDIGDGAAKKLDGSAKQSDGSCVSNNLSFFGISLSLPKGLYPAVVFINTILIESYGTIRLADALEFSLKLVLCIFCSDGNVIVGRISISAGIRTEDVPFLKIVEQTVAAANFPVLCFLSNNERNMRAIAIVNCVKRRLVEAAGATA